jgi:hypothetical protein
VAIEAVSTEVQHFPAGESVPDSHRLDPSSTP